MKKIHVFFVILAMLSPPLLGQGINSNSDRVPNNAVSAGTQYSIDAQEPMPFSAAAPACDSACSDGCCASDPYARTSSCLSKRGSYRVYGAIDYLLLDRTNDSSGRPIVVDASSGAQLFSTSNFDFNYESGVRATIGLGHVGNCCLPAWEVSYLGVYDWDDSAALTGINALSLAGDLGFVVNGFTLAEAIRTEYETQVQSAEVNYFGCLYECCRCDCYTRVEWLVGPRYLSLDENLALLGNNVTVANAIYDVDTDNNLYGAQGGSRIRSFRGCWGYELLGKAGVYGNDASQKQTIVDELGVNDVVLRNAAASGSQTAFVGELGFSLLARITCNSGLRCGYNLLWLEGVALAPEQLDFSDTAQSGNSLQDSGGTLMHGFNFGLEYGW
jgi:hypothetical protein